MMDTTRRYTERRQSSFHSTSSPSSIKSFDTAHSKYSSCKSSSSKESGYETYKKYSRGVAGNLSAFSSVGELKAQLRKNELVREERKRIHRDRVRRTSMDHQKDQQYQQPDYDFQQALGSNQQRKYNKRTKYIQTQAPITAADFSFLGKHVKMKPISEKSSTMTNKSQVMDELRDDSDDQGYDEANNERGRPALKFIQTTVKKHHGITNNRVDVVSEITTQSGKFGIKNDQERLRQNNYNNDNNNDADTAINTKTENDDDVKKKHFLTKPIKSMFKSVWKKVKPIFHCANIFKKEEVALERAKGNLC